MNTVLLIAGTTAIFAVGLVALAMLVSREAGGGVSNNPGLFKTGNPNLGGSASTLGLRRGEVHVPATLEAGRSGVSPRPAS